VDFREESKLNEVPEGLSKIMGNIPANDAASNVASAELESLLCVPEGEVARSLTISTALLRKWRRLGKGPRWIRVGRCIRYPVANLQNIVKS